MNLVIVKLQPPVDRLSHSLVSQVASRIFQILIVIGIGGWSARYLGPTALGKLSYVASLVGILSPIGSLGVKDSLTALLCDSSPLPGLVSSAFCIELLGTVLIGIAIVPFAVLARDPLVSILFGLAIIANFFNSTEVLEVDLFNNHKGVAVARVGFLQALAGALFALMALLTHAPLVVFGALPTMQSIVKAILLFFNSSIHSAERWLSAASLVAAKRLLSRGWPLVLSGFAISIYMRSDQVMLQWLKGAADVGQYSVAVRVAESLYFLPVILSQTFAPRLGAMVAAEAIVQNQRSTLKAFYRLAWILGLVMSLGTVAVLPPLLLLVFGDQYEPSVLALKYLAPAGFAVAAGCASGAWLNVNGQVHHLAKRTAFGAICNIALNFCLIPSFGIAGAAAATSCSQVLSVYAYGLIDSSTKSNIILLAAPFSPEIRSV